LRGLEVGQAIQVLYWVDRGQRDLIVQAPRHTDGPRGTFALRSPVRPNPIALGTSVITELDTRKGGHRHRRDRCVRRHARSRHQAVDFHRHGQGTKDNPNYKVIAENRRARFDYAIEDDLEVGIVLKGPR
jgi:hypothetical protein